MFEVRLHCVLPFTLTLPRHDEAADERSSPLLSLAMMQELAGGPSADAIHDLNVLLYHMG